MDPTRPVLHMFIHDIACQLWPHYVATFFDSGIAADKWVGTNYGDDPQLVANQLHDASLSHERFNCEYGDARIKISSQAIPRAKHPHLAVAGLRAILPV